MQNADISPGKFLATVLAAVFLLPSVSFLVEVANPTEPERFSSMLTRKRFLSSVSSHVVGQVGYVICLVRALWAR